MSDRLAYRPVELARMLGVSPQHVRKLVVDREIRSVRAGRCVLIPRSEVCKWLEEQGNETEKHGHPARLPSKDTLKLLRRVRGA
jgi:excisionase family DNA binding protein